VLTVEQEGSRALIEIDGGSDIIRAVAFGANSEYLVSGSGDEARVWREEDGKQMATMGALRVWCLAVSTDGRWIAAGTAWGDVFVWDAKTFEKVISHREDYHYINAVDFSPDSTRLVSASDNKTATAWDIATPERVQLTLAHENGVTAAKYSPQGDRVATATPDSVRIWDSNNGHLLVDFKVTVTPWFNTGLLWFNNNLFVISDSKLKQFEVSTGSAVSEWPVPESIHFSCIALPKHGEFIAYSTGQTVTFWDTATHTQLALIQHPRSIRSIAISPDDRFLAIGAEDGKIIIYGLSRITVSILSRWIVVHMNNFLSPIILL
jgi:WD40 repeat protein